MYPLSRHCSGFLFTHNLFQPHNRNLMLFCLK
uniref:Uncharacterized protein n=1 Tax=Siphoviridae sp. ctYh54 TaxID=2826379 RepID=A0A8S5MDY4_9CAUD|nr:MAG TPA: hypothetical protein [Siphoviridae sp. ctYh54]